MSLKPCVLQAGFINSQIYSRAQLIMRRAIKKYGRTGDGPPRILNLKTEERE